MIASDELADRVRGLERSVRTFRRVIACLSGFLLVALLAGALSPVGELRARKLVIEDDDGRPRIELSSGTYHTGLKISDQTGATRVSLGGGLHGATLLFKTGKGKPLFFVDANEPTNTSFLSFQNNDMDCQAVFLGSKKGEGLLKVMDFDGRTVFVAPK